MGVTVVLLRLFRLNRMKKNIILLFDLMVMASVSMAQKNMDEIRLTSPYLEYVSLDEIRDFQAYQEMHFRQAPCITYRPLHN